ncbi:hypothetical protein GCK32_014757 [Trichostrongylus colubriformis]|uniref:Uncharacterized protein n=1 Tax=Trichostrongylus colubriformis TaxID=6319 RepID=A0AAN8ID82_TRICO
MPKPTHAIVFFNSSKTADIVELSAVSGDCAVNTTTKVRWNKKFYTARIIFIGTKIECEGKIKDVTEDGTILERFFTVGESATFVQERSADDVETDSIAEALYKMKAGMRSLTGALREFEMKLQGSLSRMDRRMSSMEIALKCNRLPRERMEALLTLKLRHMTKFALASEQELYEEDPSELHPKVEDRKCTASRVNFIREVVFMTCLCTSSSNILTSRRSRKKVSGKR